MKLSTEPIAVTEAARSLLLAVLGLGQVFHLWSWSAEQNGTVLALFVAVSTFLSAFARAKSTPTANVALTIDEVKVLGG